MNIHGVELSPKHYKILKYLHKNKHVSQEQLCTKLGFYEFHDYIPYLHTADMIICETLEKNGTHMFIGDIYLTSFGEDAFLIMRDERRRFWLQGVWLPITVSAITHILLHLAEWLFPLIQQWVTNTP